MDPSGRGRKISRKNQRIAAGSPSLIDPKLRSHCPELLRPVRPISAATTLRPTDDRRLGEFLTRRQAAEFIRDELGRPISFSTASKLAALGEFAEPACGGDAVHFTRGGAHICAEARSRPTKERA